MFSQLGIGTLFGAGQKGNRHRITKGEGMTMAKLKGINVVWGLINQSEAIQKVMASGQLNLETDDVYFNPTSPAIINRCVFKIKSIGPKV
jgi:hypothetical protein